MNALEKLSHHITEVKFEHFTREIPDVVKKSIIDTIGVTLLGSKEECVSVLEEVYCSLRNSSGADGTVLGKHYRLPVEQAILINGTAAHSLDFDDTGASTQGHPTALILPALLGLSEKYHFSGKQIIEAYVAGVEVFNVLSQTAKMLHLYGWHPTSTIGTLASASACSKLLGLADKQIANAIGIACSHSGGLKANFGTMTKPLHAGRAGASGAFAALAAEKGFTASMDILDTDNNFFYTFTKQSDANFEKEIEKFANPYSIIDPGINIKRYPSCSLSHRSIDIVLELMDKVEVDLRKVEKITCRVTPRAKKVLSHDLPENGLEGKFSMPFLLACAFKYKEVTTDLFTTQNIQDPEIQRIMNLVDFEIHEDWKEGVDDWRPDVVKLQIKDAQTIEGKSVYPKGHSKNPLGYDEIKEKYLACTEFLLGRKKAEKSYQKMLHFENIEDISSLIQIFS